MYGRIAANLYHRFAKKLVFHINARICLVVQFIYYIYMANKNDLCPNISLQGTRLRERHGPKSKVVPKIAIHLLNMEFHNNMRSYRPRGLIIVFNLMSWSTEYLEMQLPKIQKSLFHIFHFDN